MKITLYTISLLFTIGAGLCTLLIPMDEIYSSLFLSIILIILSCITRLFSKDPKQRGWDLIILFAILIPVLFVRIFPPMTIFFVSFGQVFDKVVMSIIIFIAFILLIISQIDYVAIDKVKERKNNIKLFITTLIMTVLVFFGLHLYGSTLDLNKELNGGERIYLYSYGKYTPQVIETAFKDMEDGMDQVSQKMAMGYLSKMPNMSDEDKKRLEGFIFSKIIYGVGFEAQVDLMIKLNPSKAIEVLEEVNKDSAFNSKLVSLSYLYRIANNNPELKNDACIAGIKLYALAKNQAAGKQSDLNRLDYRSYGGNIKELCGIK